MVSKIAVIALVAIVACPILLGYAFNLEETTKTGYEYTGQPINITNQLVNGSTGSAYTYAHSNIYDMNSQFHTYWNVTKYPYYMDVANTEYSSVPLNNSYFTNVNFTNLTPSFAGLSSYYIEFFTSGVSMEIHAAINGVDNLLTTQSNVVSLNYTYRNNTPRCDLTYKTGTDTVRTTSYGSSNYDAMAVVMNGTGIYGFEAYKFAQADLNTKYINLSAGYYYPNTYEQYNGQWQNTFLPEYTKQFTFTMNLDSITDPNYTLHINIGPDQIVRSTVPFTHIPMALTKTTTGGVAKWTLTNESDSSAAVTELYTDPGISDNTYQFTISADCMYDETTAKYYLVIHVKAAYVGSWPSLVGIANSYKVYDLDYVVRDIPSFIYNDPISEDDLTYYYFLINADNGARSPVMRMDDALFRSFERKTITDRVFLPTQYATNPGVTLSDIKLFGSSIYVGGTTFAITNGKINVNGNSTSLNDLTFNFIDNGDSTYTLKIGGKVYSTAVTDTSMKFGGSWAANVTVQSMDTYTYTSTEWKAGSFGWDGVDHNYLMVGLVTCLGVFVALGIYARKKGSGGIIPLMIAVGCAAMVFFIML